MERHGKTIQSQEIEPTSPWVPGWFYLGTWTCSTSTRRLQPHHLKVGRWSISWGWLSNGFDSRQLMTPVPWMRSVGMCPHKSPAMARHERRTDTFQQHGLHATCRSNSSSGLSESTEPSHTSQSHHHQLMAVVSCKSLSKVPPTHTFFQTSPPPNRQSWSTNPLRTYQSMTPVTRRPTWP